MFYFVVTNKWPLQQLDVKNTVFHETLIEHVHIEQLSRSWISHSCLSITEISLWLKASSSRSIFAFQLILLRIGFSFNRADTSLFFFHQQSNLIYLLLYVDEIIVTDNNPYVFYSFTRKLNSKFATKDLGSLSYFLGLEASPTPDGLFISQLKYARDTLTRTQLLDSKPIHTSMVVSQHLSVDGSRFGIWRHQPLLGPRSRFNL